MSQYEADETYVPPHIPPQHTPRLQRQRKGKPPASLSKLHRPLTRFYCNDCKKKFRSRILANRNNNAVQHYCSLYSKIITRKVDSHSNKCKGDHGMGPCVVKRTDTDPDSDGEDETKAAYYADKGKKRPSSARKPRGAYTKKRKRDDDELDADMNNTLKRQRRDEPMHPTDAPLGYSPAYYPTTNSDGYYHPNGYVQATVPYPGQYMHNNATPVLSAHENGHSHTMGHVPPPPTYNEELSSTPPIPMPMATHEEESRQFEASIPEPETVLEAIPPPPALEPIENEETKGNDVNTASSDVSAEMKNGEDNEHPNESIEKNVGNGSNVIEMETNEKSNANNEKNVELEDDEECINDGNSDEEDGEDMPDLTVPCISPSPTNKNNGNELIESAPEQKDVEEEDDDLNLDIPQ